MLYPEKSMVNMMESSLAESMVPNANNIYDPMGVRGGVAVVGADHTKSNLDNIVGSLWQARQESSGSSVGNQSPHNGDDLSEGEGDVGSPEDEMAQKDRDGSDDQDMASDLRLPGGRPGEAGLPFPHLAHLSHLPGLPALEALNKQQKELLGSANIILPTSSPQGLLKAHSNLFPSPHHTPGAGGFTPMRPPSQPTPSSQSNSPSDFGTQQNWSFEEQFKQLYEIDDNPKRKEFLDELFAFMQKRGTPINRLPIMAKQVLDLYELYNLVCARGGLVEVINKKQWQEIIKGLGLPSSITSAAFTLRTQYTKYLYPVECKNNSFSNPNDLQSAIEGNKREGRTSSFGPYGGMPMQHSPLPPSLGGGMHMMGMMGTPPRPMQINGNRPPMHPGSRSPPGLPIGPQDPLSAFEMTRLALLKMYNQSTGSGDPRPPLSLPNIPLPPDLPGMHDKMMQDKAINLHVERQRQALEEMRRKEESDNMMKMDADRKELEERHLEERERQIRREMELKRDRLTDMGEESEGEGVSPPPCKRQDRGDMENDTEEEEASPIPRPDRETLIHNTIPGTNIKITTRGEGSDSSLVVSMELNGLTYQGILFQKPAS